MVILYVDDDPEDSEFIVEALNDLDNTINCITFTNATDALEFLMSSDQKPDFIFLDINMPKMDGKQCLKKIKGEEKLKNIPVVMCSTTLQTREMKAYFELGVHDFIVKPTTFAKLREELQAIIESPEDLNTQK
jgi:CheY-like chemotaxis protein